GKHPGGAHGIEPTKPALALFAGAGLLVCLEHRSAARLAASGAREPIRRAVATAATGTANRGAGRGRAADVDRREWPSARSVARPRRDIAARDETAVRGSGGEDR